MKKTYWQIDSGRHGNALIHVIPVVTVTFHKGHVSHAVAVVPCQQFIYVWYTIDYMSENT
jgi:hypothetical protein